MDPFHTAIADQLDAQRGALAENIVARQYAQQPDLAERYGPAGRVKCLQDANYHLVYLSEAVAAGSPGYFSDYISWAAVMLNSRGIPTADLAANLAHLRTALETALPPEAATLAGSYVDNGIAALAGTPETIPSLLLSTAPLADLAGAYLSALLRYEREAAAQLVQDAIENAVPITDVYLHVFQRVQREIGRLWQLNQISVAQEHYCTAAGQLIMAGLYPAIFYGRPRTRRIVLTCTAGELHEMGIRMVSDFMEMHGWDTVYLGANCPTTAIIQTLREHRADILAISATMPFHVRAVAALIAAVRAAFPERHLPVLVGGYAFQSQPDLWRLVGADGTATDAGETVTLANRLVEDALPA